MTGQIQNFSEETDVIRTDVGDILFWNNEEEKFVNGKLLLIDNAIEFRQEDALQKITYKNYNVFTVKSEKKGDSDYSNFAYLTFVNAGFDSPESYATNKVKRDLIISHYEKFNEYSYEKRMKFKEDVEVLFSILIDRQDIREIVYNYIDNTDHIFLFQPA